MAVAISTLQTFDRSSPVYRRALLQLGWGVAHHRRPVAASRGRVDAGHCAERRRLPLRPLRCGGCTPAPIQAAMRLTRRLNADAATVAAVVADAAPPHARGQGFATLARARAPLPPAPDEAAARSPLVPIFYPRAAFFPQGSGTSGTRRRFAHLSVVSSILSLTVSRAVPFCRTSTAPIACKDSAFLPCVL